MLGDTLECLKGFIYVHSTTWYHQEWVYNPAWAITFSRLELFNLLIPYDFIEGQDEE